MQVVYSGGSTPTPSPRVQRKHHPAGSYGRPLFIRHNPGSGPGSKATTPSIPSRTGSKETKDSQELESSLRDSIPAMKKSVAIFCLILNILLPGLGTFVAGLTTLCGSTIRFKVMTTQKVVCSNTWVAFLQFLTAFLFLLGWIWSIVWGVAFITISNAYFKDFKRPDLASKHHLITDSIDKDHSNGSTSGGVNRTGSGATLTSHVTAAHLQKPVMLRSSSADQPASHPHIVFERVPIISHSETSLVAKQKPSSSESKSSKQQKYLNPQGSDDSSQHNLEQIVIHNLPKAPVRRGILRREDTITSTVSSVSEQEYPY